MHLHAPTFALHVAALACLLGTLDGAYGLISPRGAARGPGIELAEGASLGALRALAGGRLAGHAVTLAILMTAPAVGACLAAALGSSWIGAALGRFFSALGDRRRGPADLLRIVGALGMGVATWAPLYLYLEAMRQGSGFGA